MTAFVIPNGISITTRQGKVSTSESVHKVTQLSVFLFCLSNTCLHHSSHATPPSTSLSMYGDKRILEALAFTAAMMRLRNLPSTWSTTAKRAPLQLRTPNPSLHKVLLNAPAVKRGNITPRRPWKPYSRVPRRAYTT